MAEPAFDPGLQRESPHAVGHQKDPPALGAGLRQQRLQIGEKARDMKARAARLALVPEIIVG